MQNQFRNTVSNGSLHIRPAYLVPYITINPAILASSSVDSIYLFIYLVVFFTFSFSFLQLDALLISSSIFLHAHATFSPKADN